MKKTAAAVCFAVMSTSAFAGGMEVPQMEPPVIIEEAKASAGPSGTTFMILATTIVFGTAFAN